jgi:uncharacterized protein
MTDIAQALSHLPPRKIQEIEQVVERIADTGKAEIVVLFGSYARGDYKEKRGATRGRKSDYDFLVVTSGGKRDLVESLRGKFEDIDVHVQLVVEDIDFVNSNLAEEQFFFTDIKREGKVLFTTGKHNLIDKQEVSPTRRREIAEEDFERWHGMAKDFWIDSRHPIRRGKYGKAAFELQQVAEMCYTAVEIVFTHYHPREHDLDILRERAGELDSRILDALPCDTKEHCELFSQLNYAYIGGRYRSAREFLVKREDLDYWRIETKKLLKITKVICIERIECLRNIERR